MALNTLLSNPRKKAFKIPKKALIFKLPQIRGTCLVTEEKNEVGPTLW
jgi:hypothetical protein